MSLELVTLAEAREQLRLEDPGTAGGADDAWLAIFIPAISAAVRNWVKNEWRLYEWELGADGNPIEDSSGSFVPLADSNGTYTVRPEVRGAVLVELASQFRFREGDASMEVPATAGHGYSLGRAATALLAPLRKPTIA